MIKKIIEFYKFLPVHRTSGLVFGVAVVFSAYILVENSNKNKRWIKNIIFSWKIKCKGGMC